MLLSRACPDKWKLASTVCSKAFHLNIFAVAVGQVRLTSSVPVFASASSAHDKLNKDIGPLIGREGRWILSKDGTAIERCWEFTGFNKAWSFMNAVADEAKAAKHHPEWCNVYNRVTIRWTTHRDRETKLRGLTGEDLRLAACCDELARKHGAKELSAFKSDDQESFEKLANSP